MRPPQLFRVLFTEAQRRFGRADPGWSRDAITVGQENFAQVVAGRRPNTYTVRLTSTTANDAAQRLYQLSHEVVHCLAPAIRNDTIWFEEGLATHFALTQPNLSADYIARAERLLQDRHRAPLEAFRAVSPADDAIRAMRVQQLRFDDFTPELILRHTRATAEQAEALCRRVSAELPEQL